METAPSSCCIELLSVSLLEEKCVQEFKSFALSLDMGLGWHYLLDLCWGVGQLHPVPGMMVLDAGAGTGVMQWWLAERGVSLISVDRVTRRHMPVRFRRRYRIRGWRKEDVAAGLTLRDFLPPPSPRRWYRYPNKLAASLRHWRMKSEIPAGSGTVFVYNQNLASMPDIPDNSVDAVVSISALEHNPPEGLRACLGELMRVLKPGGRLIATLHAAKERDWLHEPSRGWCYTEATLRDIFDLPRDCRSNYERYDELFEALRGCAELRNNLAQFYFRSGNNGMPWGKWDPKYQPVGVLKIKT